MNDYNYISYTHRHIFIFIPRSVSTSGSEHDFVPRVLHLQCDPGGDCRPTSNMTYSTGIIRFFTKQIATEGFSTVFGQSRCAL